MNAFELITKYLPTAVDTYFAEDSKTAILENGSKWIDVSFAEAGYVKIADVLLDGLSDYYGVQENNVSAPDYADYAGNLGNGARDGFAIGGITLRWEIYKLQWKRGKQFRIDHISDEETAKVVTGKLVEEFNRTKVIPEVDACRFSVIADQASASLGNLKVAETITATDADTGIIHRFNEAFEWLTEHEVPSEEQVIFVNPHVMTLIRNTPELNRRLLQSDVKNGNDVTLTVETYEGRPIIVVPSSRFFTDVNVGANGYAPKTTSKGINYIVCSKKAIVPIRKIEYSKFFGEGVVQDFYGSKFDYLIYHGVVVPKNKVCGVYVSTSDAVASAKANVLSVDVREGSVTNAWKLNNYFTTPAGLRGTIVYKATAITLGSTVEVDGETVKAIALGGEAVDAVATSYYFALIDEKGTALAVSGQVTLAKK